ncbi:unnamed protein product [Closterium sp. NIES-65]|nr:unnamed protein product [Closterium sp. NIES-65]
MRPRLGLLVDGLNCLAARVGVVFTCARRVLSGKTDSAIEIRAAACGTNGNKMRHDPAGGGVVPWPVLVVALATSLALIVLLHSRRAPMPPICMDELEVVVRPFHDFRGSWLAWTAGRLPPRWPTHGAPSRDAMNGLDSESESRLAAICRASLCRSLQDWASQGKQREAAAIETLALHESRMVAEVAQTQAAGSLGDTQDPPAAAQNAERLRVQHDVALLCSAPWQRALQGGVNESAWLRSAQRHGYTSAEAVARGMESVCRRLHRVQSNLLAHGSTCRNWPETCWPAPGVPFSRSALQRLDLSTPGRYLVFAMSEEQLSNARTHLVEAARVARMANRVLVLPLGSHSQIDLSHPTFLSFPLSPPHFVSPISPLFSLPPLPPPFRPPLPRRACMGASQGSNSRIDLSHPLPLCSYWDLTPFDAAPWISPELFLLLARAALKEPSVGFTWGAMACGMGALWGMACGARHVGPWHVSGRADMVSEFTGELLTFALGHVPTEHNTVLFNMPANKHDIENLVRKQYVRCWQGAQSLPLLQPHGCHKTMYSATPNPLLYPLPDPTYKHRSDKDVGCCGVVEDQHRRDKDVVLWFKTTWERVSFEPHTDDIALQQLPYNHELHYLAARIAERLPKPFLAVHFRSEFIAFRVMSDNQLLPNGHSNATMLQQQMQWCTESAVQHINAVKQQHNITAVFIAADVPYNAFSAPSRSSSWGYMEWLFETPVTSIAAQQLHWLRSRVNGTYMIDELIPALNSYDPGVVAIVDKLVCAQAAILLAGSEPCGGNRGRNALHALLAGVVEFMAELDLCDLGYGHVGPIMEGRCLAG